jgi:hypothetical protein
MEVLAPRYSKEEFAHRGDDLYERNVRLRIEKSDKGKFVFIDIEAVKFLFDISSGEKLNV